jgi:retron-type reverse transcriptase
MDLYWKLVRAGYVEKGSVTNPEVGVPQGSLVSPLLSNIYLNELDKYMESYVERVSSKDSLISKVNPKIVNLSKRLTKLSKEFRSSGDIETLKELKALRRHRNAMNSRIRIGIRIHYVRYADD